MAMYTGGQMVVYFTFENHAADSKESWYKADNLISSSYTDIFTNPFNFFSIEGYIYKTMYRLKVICTYTQRKKLSTPMFFFK